MLDVRSPSALFSCRDTLKCAKQKQAPAEDAAEEAAAAAAARVLPRRLQPKKWTMKNAWTAEEDEALLESWLRCGRSVL